MEGGRFYSQALSISRENVRDGHMQNREKEEADLDEMANGTVKRMVAHLLFGIHTGAMRRRG